VTAAPPRTHHTLTLAILALAGVTFALLQSLVAPALPVIQQELGMSGSSVTWVLTGYMVSAVVATPILGRLGDIYGKDRLLVVALGALGVGSLIAAMATSLEVLVLARVVQGLGGAVFPLAFGIARDELPHARLARGVALISALFGVGAGLGIVLAGPIVEGLGYRWLFWAPVPAVAIACVATLLLVPESPVKAHGTVNVGSAVWLSSALVCVLLATSEGPAWGWGDARVVALYAVGLTLLPLWVRRELRYDVPLVDMQMMRRRGVWTANMAAFLMGAVMFCSFVLIPQFVQAPATGFGFGGSVSQAGLILLPCTVMMLLASPLSARLGRRAGNRLPLGLGGATAALSFAYLMVQHDAKWQFYAASAVLGFGIGLAFAAMPNLIFDTVPSTETGAAAAMNTVMRTLGGAVGGQAAASIIASSADGGGVTAEHGFTLAFALAAAAGALTVACAYTAPRGVKQ
jgi:EmrB/QacA subfamily drug resistance transporter